MCDNGHIPQKVKRFKEKLIWPTLYQIITIVVHGNHNIRYQDEGEIKSRVR